MKEIKIKLVDSDGGKAARGLRPVDRAEARQIAAALIEKAKTAPEGKNLEADIGKTAGRVALVFNSKAVYNLLPFKASTEKGSGMVVIKRVAVAPDAVEKKERLHAARAAQEKARRIEQIAKLKAKAEKWAAKHEAAVKANEAGGGSI